ncbi:MAG: maltose ABC transporter substrate-binding protein [Epulopiscium sp.]|nr:maltose ABC transporter substrate-binding protein [Candidatus Epulonipiscium sp.]
MLRVLSILLTVVLVGGLLVGCGKKEKTNTPSSTTPKQEDKKEDVQVDVDGLQPEEGAKLIVWESEGPETKFVEAMIEKFKEKYPSVEITYEPVGHTDAKGKLALDGPAGVGADVFAAPHDHVGELVASGLILENDLFAEEIRTGFMDAAVQGVTYQGTVYGYPTGIETYALFYNKDIVPEPAQTFDEMKAFAKEFNDPSNNKFTLMWEAGNAYYNYAFLAGYGADLFGPTGEDRDDLGFNTSAGIEGMKFYKSLHDEVYPVNSADTGWDPMMTGFKEGKAAYMINGPWAIADLKEAGLNFGVTVLPKMPNGNHPKSFSGIRGNYVSAYTQYPNAAKLFAGFMSSEESLQTRYEITNQLPPHNNLLNVIDDEHLKGVLEQAQYAFPMPSIPEMGSFWNILPTAFQNVWNGVGESEPEIEAAAEALKASYQ